MTTFIQPGAGVAVNHAENPPLRNAPGGRILSIVEIVLGGILILIDVIGLSLGLQYIDITTAVGAGIWTGVLFIATGIIGVFATKPPHTGVNRKGLFTGFLVMSILSSLQAFGMFIASAVAVTLSTYSYTCAYSYHYSYATACAVYRSYGDIVTAFRVIAIIIYLALLVIFIVTASFSGCNVCRGTTTRVVTSQQVVYHQSYPAQQQVYGQHQMVHTQTYPVQQQQTTTTHYYAPQQQPQQANMTPVHFMAGGVPGPSTYQPPMAGPYEQPPAYVPPASADTAKGGVPA